jgi:hypothetical protein
VSTSKDRSIAQVFAGNSLHETSVPVLLKYIIKQNQTAIDIEHMSTIQDEQEVLILPFSVFRIKNQIETNGEPRLVEIDLEECEDNEQIDRKNKNRKSYQLILSSLVYQSCPIGEYLTICVWSLIIILSLAGIVIGSIFSTRPPSATCRKSNEDEVLFLDNGKVSTASSL